MQEVTLCVCTDRHVILGGHRDAWVFGGIDPMSGAAVVHETVRSAGRLLSQGKSIALSTLISYLGVLMKTSDKVFVFLRMERLEAPTDHSVWQLGR